MMVRFLVNRESDLGLMINEYRANNISFCGQFARATNTDITCSMNLEPPYDFYHVIDNFHTDSYPENSLVAQTLWNMVEFLVKEHGSD